MDETKPEKYDYEDFEHISRSDLLLAEHYEELFYLSPKELAVAINAMTGDELLQFNHTTRNGHGVNVDLMIEKLDEMNKYQNLNSIFMEAFLRTTLIDIGEDIHGSPTDKGSFYIMFSELQKMFEDKGKCPKSMVKSYDILFVIYPEFRAHFLKLKTAGIIEETENGLKWKRSKTAAAEYFECLNCMERNRRWSFVEKAFGYKDLCQCLHTHRERQNGKPSKDFEEIQELLGIE